MCPYTCVSRRYLYDKTYVTDMKISHIGQIYLSCVRSAKSESCMDASFDIIFLV